MKKNSILQCLTLLIIVIINIKVFAFTTAETNLKITIVGLKSGVGDVGLTLFNKNNEKYFPLHPEKALIEDYKHLNGSHEIEFVYLNLPPGEYAALAYHDEDQNKKINTNFLGLPSEGYGASQNAPSSFGPPSFKDAKFNLPDSNSEIAIEFRINY